jgi:hypothetical protein
MGIWSRTSSLFLFGVLAGILLTTLCLYSPPSTGSIVTHSPNASRDIDAGHTHQLTQCSECRCRVDENATKRGGIDEVAINESGESVAGEHSTAIAFGAQAMNVKNNHSTSCPAAQFQVYEGIDYNQGPAYDLDSLHRSGPGASRFAPLTFAKTCSFDDYDVLKRTRVKDDGLESKHYFLARCMAKCLEARECTGFVVRGDVCYLKRLMPFLATRESQLVSFIRTPPLATAALSQPASRVDEPSRGSMVAYEPVKFDPHFRSRVLLGVLGNAAQAHERLIPAISTWLCEWDAVILLEENPVARALVKKLKKSSQRQTSSDANATTPPLLSPGSSMPRVDRKCLFGKQFVFEEEPRDAKLRAFNGAWKNLPIARLMVEMHGRNSSSTQPRDWFAIVDDDSFLLSYNFNIFFNSVVEQLHSPQRDAVSVGVVFTDGKVSFVQGGAGIFLSAEAIHRVVANYTECLAKCVTWAGDIRLGCCYPIVGVRMAPFPVFFSLDVVKIQNEEALGKGPAALIPITFHQLKTKSFIFAAYNAEQLVLGRPLLEFEPSRRSGTALVQCATSLKTPQVPLHCADPILRFPTLENRDATPSLSGASDSAQLPPLQIQESLNCGALSSRSYVSWSAFSFALQKFGCS